MRKKKVTIKKKVIKILLRRETKTENNFSVLQEKDIEPVLDRRNNPQLIK